MKRNHKNWLKAYIDFTRASEAPDVFHAATGMFTIASALRRRVWIDQRIFQWTPNLYIIFVAPPGIATKSTTARIGTKLLSNIDGIHFGPQSMTWQALTDTLTDARALVPFGSDYLPMACVSCVISELGTFLKPRDTDMIDVLTDLWDGQLGTWQHRTRMLKGEKIENPWISILGATTPSWIRDNIPETAVEGGLVSRTIFIYRDAKRHFAPYPADLVLGSEFQEEEERLVEDLHIIAETIGEYELTSEAKQWGTEWYRSHWTKRPSHLSSERFGGYISRKQTHIHKLAMCIAAAKRSDLYISQKDLETAEKFITSTEEDLIRVLEHVGSSHEARIRNEVLAYIVAHSNGISHRDLWRRFMGRLAVDDYISSISGGVRAGLIRQEQKGDSIILYPIRKEEEK